MTVLTDTDNTHPSSSALQQSLQSKTYFGFDLDDTLHEFRKASSTASSAVLEAINTKFAISIAALQTTYRTILSTKTATAFTDGKTSTEYRQDRFGAVLKAHNVEISSREMDWLLGIYQSTLQTALTRKLGSLELLQRLKSLGKKVIIVTEGPQDAQEWTIRELGFQPYIDILVTTNSMGKAKVDGLFGLVLERYGILAEDMVYVGDNEMRDVLPARAVGILGILYDEKREGVFDDPGGFCVNSLVELEHLVGQ